MPKRFWHAKRPRPTGFFYALLGIATYLVLPDWSQEKSLQSLSFAAIATIPFTDQDKLHSKLSEHSTLCGSMQQLVKNFRLHIGSVPVHDGYRVEMANDFFRPLTALFDLADKILGTLADS